MPPSVHDSHTETGAAGRPSTPREPALPAATLSLESAVFVLFVVALAGSTVGLFSSEGMQARWRWLEPVLWLLAAATTLVNLAARASFQNVLIIGPLTVLFAWVVELMNARSGVPFGPRVFTAELGAYFLGSIPWPMPLVWLVMLLNSRGVARLLLRPFRRATYYGFWLIGVTGLVTALFDVGLEPFAGHARRYWLWQTPPTVLAWHGAPWAGFLGWVAATSILLGFTTPWFITKRPVPQPLDFHPLGVWALLQLYFAAGCAAHQSWAGAIAAAVLGVGISVAAGWCVRVEHAARKAEE